MHNELVIYLMLMAILLIGITKNKSKEFYMINKLQTINNKIKQIENKFDMNKLVFKQMKLIDKYMNDLEK